MTKASAVRIVLGVLGGGALLAALLVDFPALSEGKLWSDGASYLAMSLSLAHDGDLRYEARDLARFEEIYAYGPHGLFLKKSAGGLYYAKALLYPLVGAPFVRVLGGTRGLLVLNALCFGLGLGLGYGELRRRGIGEWPSLLVVLGLFVCGVSPVVRVVADAGGVQLRVDHARPRDVVARSSPCGRRCSWGWPSTRSRRTCSWPRRCFWSRF